MASTKMKIKKDKSGGHVVMVLVKHPMETGNRKDKKTGKYPAPKETVFFRLLSKTDPLELDYLRNATPWKGATRRRGAMAGGRV